jgi:ankyrin repeat protein
MLDAALNSDEAKLREALAKGFGLDDYDELGLTPLLSAVFIGHVDAVRMLLLMGADANKPQRDDESATPLWHAQEDFGLLEIFEVLRANGARLRLFQLP